LFIYSSIIMKHRRNYTHKRRRIYGGNTERLPTDTDLTYAIRKGNLEEIHRIVEENPASINILSSDGITPLIYAIRSNNIDIVKYIISAGANVNEKGRHDRPISQVLRPNISNDIFDEILKANPDLNFKPNVLYLSFALKSQPYKINELLSRIDVNSVIDSNSIPLILAFKYNARQDIINKIIDLTTNINISDELGNTPLHYSVCLEGIDNSIITTDNLIIKGANINKKNSNGDTPLLKAIECIHIDTINVIDYFIFKGANINEINNDGDNILTLLLIHSDNSYSDLTFDIASKIIRDGININHKNNDGLSALHFIAANTNSIQLDTGIVSQIIKIIDFLIENGAKISDDIVSSISNKYIRNYLKEKYDKQRLVNTSAVKWKGFTRGDLEKLNTIFDPSGNPANVSMCPVCLKYVERSEACNYMTHDCSTEGYYHRNLFDKYKNTHNHVSWCTLCGRICRGHNHYPLSSVDDPVPNVIIGTDPFAKDCRVDGGGGLEEKIMRFRTMREYTKRLQLEIGKISHEAAMNELVEAMWNPGMMQRIVSNIIRNKKFNISINEFPEHIERNAITSAPPNSYMTPKVLGKGTN